MSWQILGTLLAYKNSFVQEKGHNIQLPTHCCQVKGCPARFIRLILQTWSLWFAQYNHAYIIASKSEQNNSHIFLSQHKQCCSSSLSLALKKKGIGCTVKQLYAFWPTTSDFSFDTFLGLGSFP